MKLPAGRRWRRRPPALQVASGGTWTGCAADVDRIVATLQRGAALSAGGAR